MKGESGVIDVPREQLDEAALLLARAFEDDPLARHIFSDQGDNYQAALQELFRFSCLVRLDLGWPLLGRMGEGGLAAVAGVTEPEEKAWPASLERTYTRLAGFIGPEATRRLESYSAQVDGHRPVEPHYFLGVIGVRPEEQGKGHARVLLDVLHGLSEAHPASRGVALDTENPRNVEVYGHFGYRVTAEVRIEGVTVWCMFRPDGTVSKSGR